MTDPRRSARSTKGVNSRLSEINVLETASPTPAKRRKSTPKNSTSASESPSREDGDVEGKPDDIIRCVCGASEEDEDDDRMMIQCEGCDAWQHTQCMGIPKKKIPKQYFCEVCSPDRHEFLLEQMALGEKPWEKKGGMRKRAPAKQKEAAATPVKPKETTPKQKEATKEAAPKQKEVTPKLKEATPARGKRGASTTTEKSKAAPVAPAPPPPPPTTTTTPRTTSRSRTASNKAATETPKVTAPPATPRTAAISEKAAPASASPPTAESVGDEVVQDVEASVSKEKSRKKNGEDVPMEDVKPVNDDKMDIDEPESEVPVVESSEEALDRTDRDATIPAEDMPPPPAPPLPPHTFVEAKPNKSLPHIVTDTAAQRPKNKKDGSDTVMTPKTPKSAKRKSSADSDSEYKGDDDKPVEKKQRRGSIVAHSPEVTTPKTPHPADRRKSSSAAVRSSPASKLDYTPQTELVEKIEDLRNSHRQKVVMYMKTCMSEHAKRLVDDKKITLQPESTVDSLCENRALQIEHHVYLNHNTDGTLPGEYSKRARTISSNLKSNAALSDEILGGRLSCERLAHMTTEEMASQELKDLTQQVRMESEKHNTLINETGPRIRRTHKGEELVNEEMPAQSGQDTLLDTGAVVSQRPEPIDDLTPAPPAGSDTPMGSQSPKQPADASISPPPGTSETPRSPSQTLPVEGPTAEKDKKKKDNRSFNIETVWSHVESPDTERRPTRPPPAQMLQRITPTDSKIDKDIDNMLRDDDAGTPPYSPHSYNDPYSPKPDLDDNTVWRGLIEMSFIGKFNATASLIGGPERIGDMPWLELLAPVIDIDGRIKHARATEYLCGQRFSKSSTMILASLKPEHLASQTSFDKLFEYFSLKQRYGVVSKRGEKWMKDLYVIPLDVGEPLPDWFGVVDPQCKIPENRSSKMVVLACVVIRGLVPGYVENGQARGSFSMPSTPSAPQFATPQQPMPSPFPSGNMTHRPQPTHQAFSPATAAPPQMHPHYANNQHSNMQVQYGYPPQQPMNLPPLQQYPPPPPLQPTTYVPTHAMTRELIQIIPRLSEIQARAIDKLLLDNPSLQTNPDVLAREVEKVLGAVTA